MSNVLEKVELQLRKDGTYECNVNISVEEWKQILQDEELSPPELIETLRMFYVSPDHTIELKSDEQRILARRFHFPVYMNGVLNDFGIKVENKLKRFELINIRMKRMPRFKKYYVHIPMIGTYKPYKLKIRPELVKAMEELGLTSSNENVTCHWIIPISSNTFDVGACLEKYGFVDWKQSYFIRTGDFVYLYFSEPDQTIRYKMQVTATGITFEESQSEVEFWHKKSEYNAAKNSNQYCCRCIPLSFLSTTELSLDKLIANGLAESPKSRHIRIHGELLSFINRSFEQTVQDAEQAEELEEEFEEEFNDHIGDDNKENIGEKFNDRKYSEGETSSIQRYSKKRNRHARQKCLELKGYSCYVCDFNFEDVYGELGKKYIHVHHITPISEREGNYDLNIEEDLAPVCPNCHAMLHQPYNGRNISITELRQLLNYRRSKKE